MSPETHSSMANFIWSICNLLRGPYKRNEYLYFTILALRPELFNTATLNTQINLNTERFGVLPCVQTPQDEQVEIVNYLDNCQTNNELLVSAVNAAIEKLLVYKTVLISAVATGKIDVRGEVQA